MVQVQFTDFDIEGSYNCVYDYLELRDGESENSTVLGRYCGDTGQVQTSKDISLTHQNILQAPEMITSSYNHLYFTFVTDGSMNNRGFVMNYTTVEVPLTTTALHCTALSRFAAGQAGYCGSGLG